ncbi:MAG: glycosyltransferase family A protein [Deltaproteobacteria bacterium]
MPRRPLVTAVVAAHQAARHLRSALASLASQTQGDLEVIVVDDGSTDGTSAVAEAFARADPRFQVVRLDANRGQAAALNVGLDAARGRFLALLDADDEATPGRLARQVAAFERDPGLVLVGGAVATFCDRHAVEGQIWRYATDDGQVRARTLFKSEVISGAITFDRERLAREGVRFDETLRLGVDWALSAAALRLGRVENVEPVVMRYRIHPRQMTVEMGDDLSSDSTRIRRDVLAWAGVAPTDEEMRTHLAVSPCNYWPFGAHPFFRERGAAILRDAERWLARLQVAAARTERVPAGPLRDWVEEILAATRRALREPPESEPGPVRSCPVAAPRACIAEEPCR